MGRAVPRGRSRAHADPRSPQARRHESRSSSRRAEKNNLRATPSHPSRVSRTPPLPRAGASSSQQQPLADISAQLRQRVDPHTGEVLFTLDSVKDIVRRAVDEKERSLREQYDRILQQKLQGARAHIAHARAPPPPAGASPRRRLAPPHGPHMQPRRFPFAHAPLHTLRARPSFAEQYQAFAKFNEDYISRSLKSSDLAYVS